MKRKDYQKPTMKVVKLEHYCDILAGSLGANRGDTYGTAVEETWGDDSSSSRRREGYNWDDEENEEEF